MKIMINITNHQGNENQNHNEIPPHIFEDGYYQNDKGCEDVEKMEPLAGM